MSDRKTLDFKAIEDWALAHGFHQTPDNNLSARHGEGSVLIEFLSRDLRVSAVRGEHHQRLITAHPKQLHIDENDMLQGAGLFSRFYTSYRDDHRERPESALVPVWFGEKVRAMIAEHIAKEEQETRLTPIGR
ncbi:hypothetical protein [Rhizobium sp. MHM7A]|uniref:hypothetical protein n=1 Tax=Rhizobium sp. MHM7A TaxID=2583233 RepID=UPI00110756A5|nr:hypothetical protein [Rhizobium sp. MHM7A]TLX16548.1 hypothetical protein FFR93_04210 [Rhizobium sp. MHM7A]